MARIFKGLLFPSRSFILLFLALSLALLPTIGQAQETYVVQPVQESAEIKAFSSQGWLTMKGLPAKDHYIFKIAYLRGFLDAVQFAAVAPGQTAKVLDELQGTDLKKLADDIDDFYQKYPQYQSYSPAVVLLVILPRLKAGKPPLPEADENNETEEQAGPKPAGSAPESSDQPDQARQSDQSSQNDLVTKPAGSN